MSDNLKTWPEVAHVGFTSWQLEIPEYEISPDEGFYINAKPAKDSVCYIRADVAKEREDRLVKALKEAREDICVWGAHASNYWRNKYGFEECLAGYDAVIAEFKQVE